MNKKFFNLPKEKQCRIINAGFKVFSTYPYSRAPMSTIASEGQISKSLLFYYFNNKKELYLFLFSYANRYMDKINEREQLYLETDFFILMEKIVEQKILMMAKYPYLYGFLGKAYYEQLDIVRDDIERLKKRAAMDVKNEILNHINLDKFRYPEDISSIYDLINLTVQGYMYNKTEDAFQNSETLLKDFKNLIEPLKRNFYKENE